MSADSAFAVLFDLDGTLVDTIDLIVGSYQHAVRTVTGRLPDVRESRSWIGMPLQTTLEAVDPERSEEIQRVYQEWNLANSERLIRPYPGVCDVLAGLRRATVPIGVATSKRRFNADLALRLAGLAEVIDVVACMESTTTHKPEPAPLLFAAEVLQVEAARCVYVGDAVVDVQAATAAGMRSVAVSWGAGELDALVAAGAETIVHTAEELSLALQRVG